VKEQQNSKPSTPNPFSLKFILQACLNFFQYSSALRKRVIFFQRFSLQRIWVSNCSAKLCEDFFWFWQLRSFELNAQFLKLNAQRLYKEIAGAQLIKN
jgi:hypothetical protein